MTFEEHAEAAKAHLREMIRELEPLVGPAGCMTLTRAMDEIDRGVNRWRMER